MKTVLSLVLSFFIASSFAQDYSFEQLYKGILEDNSSAARSKLKTEVVYAHKSETSSKGAFLYKKHFNNKGQLVSSRWLDESINKFVDSEFSYDSLNRLVKMTSNINSLVNDLDITVIRYVSGNTVAAMLHYYGPKGSVKMDTLNYYYSASGQPAKKIYSYRVEGSQHKDSVLYFYKDNNLWYTKKMAPGVKPGAILIGPSIVASGISVGLVLWTVYENRKAAEKSLVLNTKGCEAKIQHPLKKDFMEVKRDSLCNMVSWEYVADVKEKWVVLEEGKATYAGKLKTEEKVYAGKAGFDASRTGLLSFEEHLKYTYSPDGLLQQKAWYKENGKLKRLQKHTYEFF